MDRYLTEYAPGALERGMTLERVPVSPPIWFTDESNTVTVIGELDGPQTWWAMTAIGRPDEGLGRWWSQMEPLVTSRTRSMASTAADLDRLCDV